MSHSCSTLTFDSHCSDLVILGNRKRGFVFMKPEPGNLYRVLVTRFIGSTNQTQLSGITFAGLKGERELVIKTDKTQTLNG